MIKDSCYLTVYGTLRPFFTNPHAQFLREHGRYVGEAHFPGLLLDLGDYPGALYQPDSLACVSGTLYNMGNYQQVILTYLDNYEGIGPEFDQPTEYMRKLIPIQCLNEVINCWIYLYNHPTINKPVIASGDYVQHSSEKSKSCQS